MPPMLMIHENDPADELMKSVGDLSEYKVFSNWILVGTYVRPEKTASGIYLTQSTIDEDKFQGKVGIVLKKGPLAFVDDINVSFHGQNVEVGDWVSFRLSDSTKVSVNGVPCRLLSDTAIKMVIPAPDKVW